MESRSIKLLEQAVERRRPLQRVTDAMRLVNGSADGLKGLVLEQYHRNFLIQVFDRRWLAYREDLIRFVKGSLGGAYLVAKDRSASILASPDSFTAHVWIEGDSRTMVTENGLQFKVDLNDTLNSGLFLDMRRNRAGLGSLVKRRKVLNCFSYTCSFGVYCRAGGAARVVNVDISQKSLTRGRENYACNRLAFEKNEFIRADAMRYLKQATFKDNCFDLIILDPPSFARHEGKSFSVKNDFPQLISLAIKALNPGGQLFVATNCAGISHDDLEGMSCAAACGRTVKDIERLGLDQDFIGLGGAQMSHLAALLVSVD